MKQKLTTTLFLLVFFMPFTNAQTWEVGGFMGVSNYLGDLQQANFEMNTTNPAMGFFTRYNVNNLLAVKAHLYKGEISGSDANYEEYGGVRGRNLSFRSHLYEIGLQGEMTFLWFGDESKKLAAPYFFGGVSLFYFNPQAQYQGKWVDLQPLGTEGQTMGGDYGDKYDRVQVSLPMGIGFNVTVSPKIHLGFEFGFRKTFTDYLDDVSGAYPDIDALNRTDPMAAALSYRAPELVDYPMPNPEGGFRGSPSGKDMYFFGGFTFSAVVATVYKGKRHKKKSRRQ